MARSSLLAWPFRSSVPGGGSRDDGLQREVGRPAGRRRGFKHYDVEVRDAVAAHVAGDHGDRCRRRRSAAGRRRRCKRAMPMKLEAAVAGRAAIGVDLTRSMRSAWAWLKSVIRSALATPSRCRRRRRRRSGRRRCRRSAGLSARAASACIVEAPAAERVGGVAAGQVCSMGRAGDRLDEGQGVTLTGGCRCCAMPRASFTITPAGAVGEVGGVEAGAAVEVVCSWRRRGSSVGSGDAGSVCRG